jgi:hypothetical protein
VWLFEKKNEGDKLKKQCSCYDSEKGGRASKEKKGQEGRHEEKENGEPIIWGFWQQAQQDADDDAGSGGGDGRSQAIRSKWMDRIAFQRQCPAAVSGEKIREEH